MQLSAICLQNYLESSAGGKIPWADLRYIFGEIMYGGHIVNDFDRLLANTYLDFYMRDELLDEMEMFPFVGDEKGPSFMCLAPSSYDKYLEHIETELKTNSPLAFGLHPNAEIDFRTTQSENLSPPCYNGINAKRSSVTTPPSSLQIIYTGNEFGKLLSDERTTTLINALMYFITLPYSYTVYGN